MGSEIFFVNNADGSNRRQLTFSSTVFDQSPDWQPIQCKKKKGKKGSAAAKKKCKKKRKK